ncbi:MAG: efflux RND transporter permease subunit [Deltaproteobacteria bacterium]|nr:efflux RND transporter permease subunit [Deltaproteobacteria bacterium]
MIKELLSWSVSRPWATLLLALALLLLGARALWVLPVDIFPDLTPPTVTVMADAHGLVPEEVEARVTVPLEVALAGTQDLEGMRSTSGDGLSQVHLTFAWGTDPYLARQMVQERLQLAISALPEGVQVELAPMASLTGEVLDLALVADEGALSPQELHTFGLWTVRPRLMAVPGVAQVVMIGGEARQLQVLADPNRLQRQGLSLGALADGLRGASQNASGGYLVQGNRELPVRFFGRLTTPEEVEETVVGTVSGRPLRVRDVARVEEGAEYPRGSAAVDGEPGVVFLVFKQRGVNTLSLTERVDAVAEELGNTLPEGVHLRRDLFRQATFLRQGVDNVLDAVRDGAILVALVLWAFLRNRRAAAVTLVAIPLSMAATALVLQALGMSLNTMTLGGMALAVGELVDDAIVGVENTLRRLREPAGGRGLAERVIAATVEVRGPMLTGTAMVMVVFLPLLALQGLEGRLFAPLAISYGVALLASLVVSLTVTPALGMLLFRRPQPDPGGASRGLERLAGWGIGLSLRRRWLVLGAAALLHAVGLLLFLRADAELLPSFDEGTVLVMTFAPAGTSLEASAGMADQLAHALAEVPGVQSVTRYTGRGEHDEHAPPVGISHILLTLDAKGAASREQTLAEVRARSARIPGLSASVGQPLAHRMDHLMSGVQAQVALKVHGPDLETLRELAAKVAGVIRKVPGATDVQVEPEALAPQLHVHPHQGRIATVGLSPGALAEELERAVGGEVVGEVLDGTRRFDLLVRLERPARGSVEALRALPLSLPTGGLARLGDLARIDEASGPTAISRDEGLRRVAVQANVAGRAVGAAVEAMEAAVREAEASFPPGYGVTMEGQFRSQRSASRTLLGLSLVALLGVVGLLSARFGSLRLGLLVLASVPSAWVGGILLLALTGQPLSVPALVGFVSLTGLAGRNGLLLLTRTLQGMDGAPLSEGLLRRSGMDRAVPVVMTGLTTGVGLAPLLLAGQSTGRELLYPVATVVVGGLISSTVAEFSLRPILFWTLGRGAAEALGRRGGVGE